MFSGGFQSPQNDLQDFKKKPQIGTPQIFCGSLMQPLVSHHTASVNLAEAENPI
jgi:hypothetical protein